MKLQREPRVPTQYELAAVAGRMLPRKVHPAWAPYLGIVSDDDAEDGSKGEAEALSRERERMGTAIEDDVEEDQ